ncbi:BREX-2 system adenine-specific DNA-methyltransferase PglX [Cellulomonas sp. zg-ZUI199]|uniref:site-specific DNA-methyltransferase (adenine-specific) n=1 Tax=Cellulomonas wangleii TaxID=2816956 RepID=A0ABX8D3Q5_9CELL|nr:BREX-2 system adenine-specific DNA-methyltransferase PglX [Cellulomonas wangleii]MBO0923784.1 BREX-2 system adenine-specific DNA-methyltransferase PglX [Cellulomonas wangleii]MBO0924066.1 BREX-2 system adenine-specific DNA-methyltransferase PglX [Cellulomonas wangleii]QVI62091.1 BREX-2 system adenine-specific DNA-methyltransferase PglX [Cellulomonas wangleii]
MIHSSALLADLKAQLRVLQADLKARADDPTTEWGAALQREHAEALRRERTGLSWTVWRDNEVDQAAVAWIIATTFIRFCEDNDLLAGATLDGMPVPVGWIAGPGDRWARARENQTAYFRVHTSHHDRDWLQQAFRVLAAQPAGVALVDPKHNPVWTAEISAEAAKGLVSFWRRTDDDGTLIHDFTDPDLDTRFLGDLYQELSEHAKKTYALLQTPEFVEEFILDRTLTPAIAEFGIDGLKLIDPTCGSGHFLLGAFQRLNAQWATEAPGLDPKQRVRKAMDSIHGVDLNPFAVAIARFRLTVAGITAAGEKSLVGVPPLGFHLAIGDSLLGEQGGGVGLFDDNETFTYDTEDLDEYAGILKPGQYHVVVGNPPYITAKDPAANARYRAAYRTAYKQYALSVPFAELFFRLALKGDFAGSAGHVGQITSNSFMKREFGKKLIEGLFAGKDPELAFSCPVDLTHIIDSAGAWMPGHNHDGTPTVILVGRRRRPVSARVRVVLKNRDDAGKRADPENGPNWTEIVNNLDNPGFEGTYVSVADRDRDALAIFPWALSGGGSAELIAQIESNASSRLGEALERPIGGAIRAGADEVYMRPRLLASERSFKAFTRPFVVGDGVRDWRSSATDQILFPYDGSTLRSSSELDSILWPWRTTLARRGTFQGVMADAGLRWTDYMQFTRWSAMAEMVICFAFVATHNHFSLVRGRKIFNRSAPVLKLSMGATEGRHIELLAVLNSSVACFWLKYVSQEKGGDADTPWLRTWEFTGTKLQELPLPAHLPQNRGDVIEALARELASNVPEVVIQGWLESDQAFDLTQALEAARATAERLRGRLIFEQEELDWEVYWNYGLIEEALIYDSSKDVKPQQHLASSERPFALVLALGEAGNPAATVWFDYKDARSGNEHCFPRVTEIPADWPEGYRELTRRRLAAITANQAVRQLERPEFKRRWATVPWDSEVRSAVKSAVLDRLDDSELWRDAQGPVARSVVQLADLLRNDPVLLGLAQTLTGAREPDVAGVIGGLLSHEGVPYLAAHRFTATGVEKFREWQRVWSLQRREDAGEKVAIAVPPKYGDKDFQDSTYWKARGKLDVPKERFILYPGVGREGDSSPVLGWAGWNHRDRAVALAREILTQQGLGAPDEALVPLVAGLVELEPWLHQWHTDLEPEFGSSAAQAVTSQIDQLLAQLQMTRDDVNAWRPPGATRGRRPRS